MLLRLDALNLSGLGSDGMIALTDFLSCEMGVLSPASPALRTFGLPAGLCSSGDALAVAGGRIVYQTSSGYAVTDSQGVGHALAGARVRGTAGSPVAFDGRTAFVVDADCDADRLLAVAADVPAAAPPPSPAGPASCPQRRAKPRRLRVQRGGRVTIALRCPQGCRGTLRLVQQRRGRRERLVGHADYGGDAGTVLARPRIARYARALAGCRGGLRAVGLLHPVGDDHSSVGAGRGKGLGSYRIVARARCRRTGGPPFTAPRRGPRP